jgi:hypothetical protein
VGDLVIMMYNNCVGSLDGQKHEQLPHYCILQMSLNTAQIIFVLVNQETKK